MTQVFNFEAFTEASTGSKRQAFLDAIKHLPAPTPGGPWICGGAIRRTLIGQPLDSDVDYFFASAEQLERFTAEVTTLLGKPTAETEHCVTWKSKDTVVQAIKVQFYESIDAVLDSFDFTITQFGFDGTQLHCGDRSLWDLGRRKLLVHKITFPVASVRRFLKYQLQGFTVCNGAIAAVLNAVAEQPELLEEKLAYVD